MEETQIDYDIIGKRIKQARINKGYSQNILAEELDVTVAYLSRVERGKSKINLARLNEICKLLDISMGEILTGISTKSKQYLDKDLYEILVKCTPNKQKLIYELAKLVLEVNLE